MDKLTKAGIEALSEENPPTKEDLFIYTYLQNGFNVTRAAATAGYSEHSAYAIGHELLKKPRVKAKISDLINTRMKSIGISLDAKDIITAIAEIAISPDAKLDTRLKALEMLGRNKNIYEQEKETEARTLTIINAAK